MKLYFSPAACSLSPHIVLREGGFAFDTERVDLATKRTASGGDYTRVNPRGYVPALQLDDGQILTEGPAIVQYLADRVAERKLAPSPGSMERYRLVEWLNFISTELHKAFGTLFNPNCPAEWKAAVTELIGRRLAWVARELEGRPFVMGENFTVADAYLFTVLNWAAPMKIDLGQWPVLAEYHKRVAARPAVREAMRAEGLIKD